jgi:tetratricopeptide (TPR) repeat protein
MTRTFDRSGPSGAFAPRAWRTAQAASAALVLGALLAGGCAGTTESPMSASERLNAALRQGERAQELARDGRADEAIAAYRDSIGTYDQYAPTWYNLGVLLMAQGKNVEAASALTAAAELDLSDPRAYTALGLLAQDLLHYQEAGDYYRLALDRNPQYLPALRKSVEIDQLLDRYEDSTLQNIRRALYAETDPKWKEFLLRQKLKTEERLARASGSR